jgi:tetratricopeptide (TPR) repeat protein
MDRDDEVLPVEQNWGRLLLNHPYSACPDLEVLEVIAAKGPRAPHYEERMQHIVSCGNCRDILDQLRLLDAQWQENNERTWQARTLQTFQRGSRIGFPAFAFGFAVILLFVILFDRTQTVKDKQHSRQLEQQLVLEKKRSQDAQFAWGRTEKEFDNKIANIQKKLRGMENRYPQFIKDDRKLIASAQVQFPVRIPAGFETMRGGNDPLPSVCVYPSGTVLLTTRPTFRWKSVKGAQEYQVTLTPSSGSAGAMEKGRVQSPWRAAYSWKLADPQGRPFSLRPGHKYEWRVAWRIKGKQAGVSTYAKFETIEAQAAERLQNAVLVYGIQQAQAGQLEEAEKAFQSVLTINPQNHDATALSAVLQKAKRTAAALSTP